MFGQTQQEEVEIDRVLSLADQPVNIDTARTLLGEIKQVMDDHNVVFFLRQGTCLGAVRDGDIIPWDDDIDIGSIYGFHGFKEETIMAVIPDMQENGFLVRVTIDNDIYKCVTFIKGSMRIDWGCHWENNGSIIHYPFIPIPIKFFETLKEIDLLGQKYLVPNPPEDYLSLKYGENWRAPKRAGEYESDVLDISSNHQKSGFLLKTGRLLARILPWRSETKVRIIDREEKPVSDASVFVAGLGVYKSDINGVVKISIPRYDYYAFRIEVNDENHIIYMDKLYPEVNYLYQLGTEHFTIISDGL